MSSISGSCLCGKVYFESDNNFNEFHLCHCIQCQKVTGSAHAANIFTQPSNIKWLSGESLVKRFDVPGRAISTAFCEECGAPVPYLSRNKKDLIIPVGCLNGVPNITPQDNIFCSEKAEWYEQGLKAKSFDKFPD
ncbi:aldehyde-activating protein [Psychromonas sp. B3M02]|uniref:GFA family protein n=1 Tax=unclassified Psychromonas TaxID=2614957 RepID=UPI000DE967EB|nr:GFA family protein [Psychromonas sp. B3M02]RBW42451.1 aldehyde-activating protein [Psychromonas sp. B3M02]